MLFKAALCCQPSDFGIKRDLKMCYKVLLLSFDLSLATGRKTSPFCYIFGKWGLNSSQNLIGDEQRMLLLLHSKTL